MPQNVALVFGFIMQIASFDILPTDTFYDQYFDIDETDGVNQSFDNLGFNSMFFLSNMGSLSIAWFSVPVLILIGVLLKFCRPLTNKSLRLHRLHNSIERKIFWNYPITTFNEASSIVYMSCIINFLKLDFSTTGNKICTISAIVSLTVALVAPFIYALIILKNGENLEQK